MGHLRNKGTRILQKGSRLRTVTDVSVNGFPGLWAIAYKMKLASDGASAHEGQAHGANEG